MLVEQLMVQPPGQQATKIIEHIGVGGDGLSEPGEGRPHDPNNFLRDPLRSGSRLLHESCDEPAHFPIRNGIGSFAGDVFKSDGYTTF